MKKRISTIAWIIVLAAIVMTAKMVQSKPIKSVEVRHWILPTDSGVQFVDTSIVIEIKSANSLSINGVVFLNLQREVTPDPEENLIYDLYTNSDESFSVCFDLDVDNGNIVQVIMYKDGNYYCFR
jgi:hypothetical protein